ncbi:hypothetical protein MASR1M32_16580 [Rhodobacter sp.]
MLIKGGGHKMAAGLTVAQDRLEEAMARLSALLARQGAGEAGPQELRIDGLLMPQAATLHLAEQIESAGPFGASAPAPRFALPGVTLTARCFGESHLRLSVRNPGGQPLEAVAFGAFDGPLGPALESTGSRPFHLAGKIEVNTGAAAAAFSCVWTMPRQPYEIAFTFPLAHRGCPD